MQSAPVPCQADVSSERPPERTYQCYQEYQIAQDRRPTGMATQSKHSGHFTTDHEEIRRWAEERGAKPAHVRGTGNKKDVGMLRLDFPGYSGEGSLEPISWDEWFKKFDESGLALLYQDKTADGKKSNFNKLVSRETAESNEK